MTIISPLPNNFVNGTVADATQVDANFNQVVANANANAAHNGANSDITSLSSLSTPLSTGQGGTGRTGVPSIFGFSSGAQSFSGNATYFIGVGSGSQIEAQFQIPIPVAGTFRNMQFVATAAPGGGQSDTATLRKNGADTALTCQVSGAATQASDGTHSVNVAAGDLVDLKVVMSITAATSLFTAMFEFDVSP